MAKQRNPCSSGRTGLVPSSLQSQINPARFLLARERAWGTENWAVIDLSAGPGPVSWSLGRRRGSREAAGERLAPPAGAPGPRLLPVPVLDGPTAPARAWHLPVLPCPCPSLPVPARSCRYLSAPTRPCPYLPIPAHTRRSLPVPADTCRRPPSRGHTVAEADAPEWCHHICDLYESLIATAV